MTSTTAATFLAVPVADIRRNPNQPRKHFDTDALAELAQSIRSMGLLEPILVRPDVDGYVIVAGERRWRACQIADVTVVDVKVVDMNEADAYVLSVAENVNRQDMTSMEEAESFDQLVRYGRDVADIAGLFGKSAEYVRIRLSFLALTPDARHLLENGTMGTNLARYVAALQPGNQRVIVHRWARGEFSSEIEAAHFARSLKDGEDAEGFFELVEPTLEERITVGRKGTKTKRTLDKLDGLSALLAEVAALDPAELALALGGDLNARLAQLERVTTVAQNARQTMRKAKAHAAAAVVDVRPEVQA